MLFRKKQDKTPASRDFLSIFKRLEQMKNEELEIVKDDLAEESLDWYQTFAVDAYEQITKSSFRDAKPKKQILLNSQSDYYAMNRREGMLYTFMYEPETENLDYWDRFPLVLRMLDESDSRSSMMGINLHYLNPLFRRMLMMSLISKLSGDPADPNSKIFGLNISRLLKPANKYGRVCIRRYKYDNIRGKVLKIPPEHWLKVIFLPTYQFIGAKPEKVWKDSYRKIRRLRVSEPFQEDDVT